jgi:hypothetical protein
MKTNKSLITPLGEISVEINGNPCDYSCESLPNEIIGNQGVPIFKVEGRYRITPLIAESMSFPIKLKCSLDTELTFDELSELETGERYSAASIYCGKTKLCIGSYDEIDEVWNKNDGCIQVINGGVILNEYTTTSIEIYVKSKEYLKYAYFCVAWVTCYTGDNNSWFAAEPSMSEYVN